MSDIVGKLEEVIGRGRIRLNEQMDLHTFLKKGGSAEFYVEIDKTSDLIKLVQKAKKLGLPVFLFGSGSKFVIPDAGIKGLTIKNNCRHFDKASVRGTVKEQQVGIDDVLLYAEAGAIVNQIVRFSIEEGLEGLEYQLGLPGTIGGAILANAKYKPKNIAIKSHLYSIKILSEEGEIQTFTKELPHIFTFEDEIFNTKEIILSVTFKLMPGDKKLLWARGEEAVRSRNG